MTSILSKMKGLLEKATSYGYTTPVEIEPEVLGALLECAEAAYWLTAYNWQSHLFNAPMHDFDMSIFAPEVREMMPRAEQLLYDALIRFAGIRSVK